MTLLPIITEPDPRFSDLGPHLRQKSQPVDQVTHDIRMLADDLHETLIEASGVGLAAPQVGILKRIIAIFLPEGYEEEGSPPRKLTLINPEIVKAGGRDSDVEGCLSFPEMLGEVERYSWSIVKAQDADGRKLRFRAKGILARVIQHEIDHLDGILFFDRMEDQSQLFYLQDLDEDTAPIEEDGADPITA